MSYRINMIKDIDVDIIAMQSAIHPPRMVDLIADYYPIECVESNRSIYGTVSYNYQGLLNRPNLKYTNPHETSTYGRNYIAKELFALPNRESFREFPFLANSQVPESVDGAVIIANYAVTNAVDPIYTIFFLVRCDRVETEPVREKSGRMILPLFDYSATGAEGMKQWIQNEPRMLAMNDFLSVSDFEKGTWISLEMDQLDHHGRKCAIAVSSTMIPISLSLKPILQDLRTEPLPTTNMVHPPTMVHSTNVGSQILREGFASSDATGDVGTDVSNLFNNMFSGLAAKDKGVSGSETTTASIRIPLHDDPNYTYQECTMVPVDDINQSTEYVYQVAGTSPMISNKTVTIQGNLLTYLVIYFTIFLLTYFGVPFVYAFLMCTILKRGYNYTGYTALIDYLKRPQNFLGFGKLTGLTVVFNIGYWLFALSIMIFGSMTYGAFYIIMWIVGYIGIVNNPLPDSCIYV